MASDAEINATFGQRAAALWGQRGLSGREVMRRAGLSSSFITRLGHGDGIGLAPAARIAQVLGVPLGQLLGPPACGQCLDAPPPGFTCNACGAKGEEAQR
jgi:transcriptional regulator with XRE-family HTH domain